MCNVYDSYVDKFIYFFVKKSMTLRFRQNRIAQSLLGDLSSPEISSEYLVYSFFVSVLTAL